MQYTVVFVVALLGYATARWLGNVQHGKSQGPPAKSANQFGTAFRALASIVRLPIHAKSYSINDGEPLILTKDQIEQIYSPDTWQRRVYDDFITVLLSKEYGMKTFPCVYATKGYKSNDQRYVFIHSDDPSEPRNVRLIGQALKAYLPISRSCGPNTTLVVLCPPTSQPRTLEQYNLDFWAFLRGLRIFDTKPWPQDIPIDTSTNKWAFCFDGVPWFPAVLTPAHSKRQSRHTPNLVYVMQPKWIFDILFNTPEKRYGACEKVRALVKDFDDVPVSPDVAHYGEPGTTESRQYYLMDENERSFCPYTALV